MTIQSRQLRPSARPLWCAAVILLLVGFALWLGRGGHEKTTTVAVPPAGPFERVAAWVEPQPNLNWYFVVRGNKRTMYLRHTSADGRFSQSTIEVPQEFGGRLFFMPDGELTIQAERRGSTRP